jgi:hypothetical protein
MFTIFQSMDMEFKCPTYHIHETVKVKIKESSNRTGVAQRVPGSLGSQIFMTIGT